MEENKEEQKIAALMSLQGNPGWLEILKVLELDIKQVNKKLQGEMDLGDSDEEVKELYGNGFLWEYLKMKRKDRMILKDLPAVLINSLQKTGDVDIGTLREGLDPYD